MRLMRPLLFRDSLEVEQGAVNAKVGGSTPSPGANMTRIEQTKLILLLEALRIKKGNKVQAAKWMGISPRALSYWVHRFKLAEHIHPDYARENANPNSAKAPYPPDPSAK